MSEVPSKGEALGLILPMQLHIGKSRNEIQNLEKVKKSKFSSIIN